MEGDWMWLLEPEGFKNEVLAQQLDRDMQVLTKLAGYPYVGLLPAVRPIPPYICADFASPGDFMGWNSFGGLGLRLGGGLQPPQAQPWLRPWRFLGKFAVNCMLKIPPRLAYVDILACETLMSAKEAINGKLQGSVAAYLRCGGLLITKLRKV